MISSVQNPKIKAVIALKDRKARRQTGLTLVDGIREVRHALDSGIAFTEVYVCPEMAGREEGKALLAALGRRDVPVCEVTARVYGRISYGDREEGVVAVCRPAVRELAGLKTGGTFLGIVVENVEKPGNLGAIVRTCDGAGVDALLLGDMKTDIFHPNVIRASTGAVFHVPVFQADNQTILEHLKARRATVVATTPHADKDYTAVDLRGPLAVAVGSEERGLEPFWIRHADERVRIPMAGVADSLNVSVTAAILLYEALRQRARRS